MKAYPDSTLEIVARQLLAGHTERLLTNGEARPGIFGLRLSPGRLEVVPIPVPADLEEIPALLRDLQDPFDAVATAVEAWTAPDTTGAPSAHAERQECLLVVLYSLGAVHTLLAPIRRDPLRVEEGTFAATAVSGRMSVAGEDVIPDRRLTH